MPAHDKRNPLEIAAFAWEFGSASTYVDAGSMGGGPPDTIKRRPYCPGCHGHGTLKKIDGEKGYICSRCDHKTTKYIYCKPGGSVYGVGTHVPRARDIADWMTDIDISGIHRELKRMHAPVLLWFRYSSTSEFDIKTRGPIERRLFISIVSELSAEMGNFNLLDAIKVHQMIALVIAGSAPGKAVPSKSAIAKAVGICRSETSTGKRWGRISDKLTALICKWDGIVIDSVSKFM